MRTERHFTNALIALAAACLATLFLIACQQSQTTAPAATAEAPKAASTDVYVIFEGPWAIVPDPKDANSILALAPKTKHHRLLGLVPAHATLDAGVYDLTIPNRPSGVVSTFDKGLFRTTVEPQNVQRALDDRLERYAIRLPKPDAYIAETRFLSRVGSIYPPEASTEQDYISAVSLRYSVNSKTGFSLAGTQDAGAAFKPLLLQLDTPIVRFEINPDGYVADACNTHPRQAFHDLTQLLGLALYVDFPSSPADCHKKDPQLVKSQKAQLLDVPALQFATRDIGSPQQAGVGAIFTQYFAPYLAPYMHSAMRTAARSVEAAIYFFHSEVCMAPIIVGTN